MFCFVMTMNTYCCEIEECHLCHISSCSIILCCFFMLILKVFYNLCMFFELLISNSFSQEKNDFYIKEAADIGHRDSGFANDNTFDELLSRSRRTFTVESSNTSGLGSVPMDELGKFPNSSKFRYSYVRPFHGMVLIGGKILHIIFCRRDVASWNP